MRRKKLIKQECEICGEKNKATLNLHHVVERTMINTTNDPMNCAIICSNCHNKIHAGLIEIIGVFPSTKLPNGRFLAFKIDGKSNLDVDSPYYKPKPKAMKVYVKN